MGLSDVVIADSSSANVTFSATSVSGGKAEYADSSRSIDSPRILTVNHQDAGSGSAKRRRHLVRFDRTEVDAEGNTGTATVYAVIDVSNKVVTAAQAYDCVVLLKNLLTEANVTKVLSGQIL